MVLNESEGGRWIAGPPACAFGCWCSGDRPLSIGKGCEFEHMLWDPKDGELFLNRTNPGESLVEVRSSTDVQIVCLIWVKRRKTHRTLS